MRSYIILFFTNLWVYSTCFAQATESNVRIVYIHGNALYKGSDGIVQKLKSNASIPRSCTILLLTAQDTVYLIPAIGDFASKCIWGPGGIAVKNLNFLSSSFDQRMSQGVKSIAAPQKKEIRGGGAESRFDFLTDTTVVYNNNRKYNPATNKSAIACSDPQDRWRLKNYERQLYLELANLQLAKRRHKQEGVNNNAECWDNTPKACFDMPSGLFTDTPKVNFINKSQNADGYVWDFGDGTFASEIDVNHHYQSRDMFKVTLYAYNPCGIDSISRVVSVLKRQVLYVPNTLQPEASDSNTLVRIWKPVGRGINPNHYKAQVFNMWGQVIWESTKVVNNQPAEGWDGMCDGAPCPQDTYMWSISAKFIDNTDWEGMDYGDGRKKVTGQIILKR